MKNAKALVMVPAKQPKTIPINRENLVRTPADYRRAEDHLYRFDGTLLTPIERLMALQLLALELPFYVQYVYPVPIFPVLGRKKFVLDFLLGERDIVIECDGKQHYDSDQAHYDKARNNELAAAGYTVLRFDGREIFEEMGDTVIPTIGRALETARPSDPSRRHTEMTRPEEIDIYDIPF